MERNSQENLFYSTGNKEYTGRLQSPENKNHNYNYAYNQSTRSTFRDIVSPTFKKEAKEFTTTLRQGNKSSSKLRMRNANSISLNSINNYDFSDNKYSTIKSNESKEKIFTNTYGENGIRVMEIKSIIKKIILII